MAAERRISGFDHLFPALAALLVALVAFTSLERQATRQLARYATELASRDLPEEARGVVLQRWLCRQPRLLPVYGSSEMAIVQSTRPDLFFRLGEHGFRAAVVGQAGDRCLALLQQLAALGPAARGKKIAVFLSPTWFLSPNEVPGRDHSAHRQFAAVFSPLQAGGLVTNGTLDDALKRRVARRLLGYRSVVQTRSPLLAWSLEELCRRTLPTRWMLLASAPLLRLQNALLTVQEICHWAGLTTHHAACRSVYAPFRPRCRRWDWGQLAGDMDRSLSKNQGRAPSHFPALVDPTSMPGGNAEPGARRSNARGGVVQSGSLKNSSEWTDLRLLLATACALDIHLLLVDQPFNCVHNDGCGLSAHERGRYYQRVGRLAAAYGVPVRDFSGHEADPQFFLDGVHPSARAWITYDEALADFFQHH